MGKRKELNSEGVLIPANVDPIKLADEIKKGMGSLFLRRLKELERKDRERKIALISEK